MKNSIQKSAAALAAVITITLISGNVLFARDLNAGDLIAAQDLAFIKAGPVHMQATGAIARPNPPVGLISSADYAFVARPYTVTAVSRRASVEPSPAGLISAADYRFLTTGAGVDLFAVYSDFTDFPAGSPLQ